MFVGSPNKVYIIDKVEGNAAQVGGHPAWASVWCAIFYLVLRLAFYICLV